MTLEKARKVAIIAFIANVIFFAGVYNYVEAKQFGIKPVKTEPWMSFGYKMKKYNYCQGKWYYKHIKCAWVRKVKK